MFSTLFDGSEVNILIAFLGGFLTFFASCLLPLVPTYLAFLSGNSLTTHNTQERWHILKTALFFVLGFVSTFIVIGFVLNRFALILGPYREWMTRIAGLLFIAMGLFILGVGKKSILQREFKFHIPESWQKHRHLYAWLTGIAFGFGWTPCIGPVLAVILFWSTQQASSLHGLLLLTSFGVGLGIPFLLVALAFDRVFPFFQKSQKLANTLQLVSGAFILITGILMLFNQFTYLSLQLLYILKLPIFTI